MHHNSFSVRLCKTSKLFCGSFNCLWALHRTGDMNTHSLSNSLCIFIPSNPNTPLLLAASRSPLTPRIKSVLKCPFLCRSVTQLSPGSSNPLPDSRRLRLECLGKSEKESNIISNLIVFEKFVSENEYLRVCVYRVLLRYTDFKLESAHHPCSTFLSVGSLLSTTKRTVEIIDSS